MPFEAAPVMRVRYEGTTLSDAFRAMQCLNAFSAAQQHPRIQRLVDDARVRPTLEMLSPSNIIVRQAQAYLDVQLTLNGRTGSIA